jgi:hypothetical protein
MSVAVGVRLNPEAQARRSVTGCETEPTPAQLQSV